MTLPDGLEVNDPIEVEWLDTTHHNGWGDRESLEERLNKESLKQRSLGYFLLADDRHLVICMDYGEDNDQIGEVQQFPIAIIQSVRKLA